MSSQNVKKLYDTKKITNSNVLKCNCPRCPEKMI